jgi:hypothetical protein
MQAARFDLCVLCESFAAFVFKKPFTAKAAKKCREEREEKPTKQNLSEYTLGGFHSKARAGIRRRYGQRSSSLIGNAPIGVGHCFLPLERMRLIAPFGTASSSH